MRLRGLLGVARGGGVGDGDEEAELFTGLGVWGAALGLTAAVAMLASARMRGVITGVGAVAENDGCGSGRAGAGGAGTVSGGGAAVTAAAGPAAVDAAGPLAGTAAKASPIP